jgi:outer membrane protein OmpA-like peptidoglycan-associated protein/outer membrane protein W
MTLKIKILLVILLANIFTIQSQTTEITKKDSTIVSSWIFGLGFNVVDDSDDVWHKLLDVNTAWNAVPYPSRLSIGKYFKNGLGIEAIASYNKYKKGKTVGGLPVTTNKNYYALDTRLSYDLNKILGETGWFDPYVGVGVGYTHDNDVSRTTANTILGFRAWFSDRFGMDVNSTGKWAINPDKTNQNHLQHAIGVVYRFSYEKELTKEGEAKLELIKAEEKETIRINDSIALTQKVVEEKRLLAEKIEKEKELERLAQLEKEKADLKIIEKNKIQSKIDALENINFDFDSNNLTSLSKKTLSNLILILTEYPTLFIEIHSHTDSRGSSSYNQALSERRLQSTLDYLFNNKIETQRVAGKAFGEEKLLNECDNDTKCSEIKHRANRRSEVKIINF